MKILRARLSPVGGTTEFISIQGRIKKLLKEDQGENFDFVMDIEGKKIVKKFGVDNINTELVGKTVPIINDNLFAKFNEDGTVSVVDKIEENHIFRFGEFYEGALPQETSVRQLELLRKTCKGVDIGDRIAPLWKQGANLQYIKNPLDAGNIQSYSDWNKKNKKFIPSWNVKHLLSPFGNKVDKPKGTEGKKGSM